MNIFKKIKGKSRNIIIRRKTFNKILKDLKYYKYENEVFYKINRDYAYMLDRKKDKINTLKNIIEENKFDDFDDNEEYYHERFKLIETKNKHNEPIYYKLYDSGSKTRIKKEEYVKLKLDKIKLKIDKKIADINNKF